MWLWRGPPLRGVRCHRPCPHGPHLPTSDCRPQADPQRTACGPVSPPPRRGHPASDSRPTEAVTPTVMWSLEQDSEGPDQRPAARCVPCAGATGLHAGRGTAAGWLCGPWAASPAACSTCAWGAARAPGGLCWPPATAPFLGSPSAGTAFWFRGVPLVSAFVPVVLVSYPKIISKASRDSIF